MSESSLRGPLHLIEFWPSQVHGLTISFERFEGVLDRVNTWIARASVKICSFEEAVKVHVRIGVMIRAGTTVDFRATAMVADQKQARVRVRV